MLEKINGMLCNRTGIELGGGVEEEWEGYRIIINPKMQISKL